MGDKAASYDQGLELVGIWTGWEIRGDTYTSSLLSRTPDSKRHH